MVDILQAIGIVALAMGQLGLWLTIMYGKGRR